jgi:exodeoxyribonuclease VII large subunit
MTEQLPFFLPPATPSPDEKREKSAPVQEERAERGERVEPASAAGEPRDAPSPHSTSTAAVLPAGQRARTATDTGADRRAGATNSPVTRTRTAYVSGRPPQQVRPPTPERDSAAPGVRDSLSDERGLESPDSGAAQTPARGAEAATPTRNVYTVSKLNREVRLLLERGLPLVWLEGELSNFSSPGSGHWYFSLKDREAQIRCAMFRVQNTRVGFTPKSGQLVLVRGRVTMYEARGDYQLIVEHLEEAGVGALKREYERLKAKLSAEGLFAVETKRELPRFPRRIGVITSPTGAAIRDVLKILARRFPPASVIVYPTPVQGSAAIPSIIRALEVANARAECDVLIIARGGGSLEDLWAFNDEGVARAIHGSKLPIVSGVGHEVDFTIADFVADARAPTPSGAAELVVPDRHACLDVLARTADRLVVAMRRELRMFSNRFDAASSRLKVMHPGARLLQQEQRLDDLEQRLVGAVRTTLQKDRSRVSEALASLLHHSPERRVRDLRLRHQTLEGRLGNAFNKALSRAENRVALAARALNTVSPLATLARGFAIVTRAADGALVMDASSVNVGDEIDARVARGKVRARVTGTEKKD